ncbi:MAG: hypothetical protein E7324_06625 [Clostridiales bacterium]|nr:hypothetical protein [Clostridiales bacterium]
MSNTKLVSFELIDRLILMVEQAKGIPLTNKIFVEKEESMSLLRRLEDSIPADLKQARELLALEKQIIDESNRQAEKTVNDANQQAQATVESANQQAQATVNDAQARASETLRSASDQANAMIADAQARANATIADAQARAQKMVSESEIIARAQAEAQEMLEATRRECEDYAARVHASMNHLMEMADAGLAQQLDALRALRQDVASNQ